MYNLQLIASKTGKNGGQQEGPSLSNSEVQKFQVESFKLDVSVSKRNFLVSNKCGRQVVVIS